MHSIWSYSKELKRVANFLVGKVGTKTHVVTNHCHFLCLYLVHYITLVDAGLLIVLKRQLQFHYLFVNTYSYYFTELGLLYGSLMQFTIYSIIYLHTNEEVFHHPHCHCLHVD
jgi:hypothetical protein